jgi:predicted metalloprotease with PDZ domain
MFAIHLDVPAGTATLNIELDLLLSSDSRGFSSAASASSELAVISWNQLLFYPQSAKADDITFTTTLRVPSGWKFGTALPVANESSNNIEFRTVSLTTLVDSPVLTGGHFKSYSLPAVNGATHQIDVAADSAAATEMKPELVQGYGRLVREFQALFGAHHYRNYRWLLTLSDRVASFGLEHHESSDDRMPERTLRLPQELAGSIVVNECALVEREVPPAGRSATPNYQEPMSGELLWVYEV